MIDDDAGLPAAVDPWPEAELPDLATVLEAEPAADPLAAPPVRSRPQPWSDRRRAAIALGAIAAVAAVIAAAAVLARDPAIMGIGPVGGPDGTALGGPTGAGGVSHLPQPGSPAGGASTTATPGPASSRSAPGGGGPGGQTGRTPTRSAPNPTASPVVYFSNYVDLSAGHAVDLETGAVGTLSGPSSLDLGVDGMTFVGLHGAQFGDPPDGIQPAKPTDCDRAAWTGKIGLSSIAAPTVLCVRSNEGRIGFLAISYVTPAAGGIGFGWTIWA